MENLDPVNDAVKPRSISMTSVARASLSTRRRSGRGPNAQVNDHDCSTVAEGFAASVIREPFIIDMWTFLTG